MNIVRYIVRTALLAAFMLSGCASSTWKRMANADGLLDFVIGVKDVPIRVDRVSDAGGRIATAHLREHGKNVFVTGLVRRQFGDAPPWAHVDVFVLDERGRILEAVSTNYMPREIPSGRRGGFPQSHYAVRLAVLPSANSTVKVVFHSAHRSECEVGDRS